MLSAVIAAQAEPSRLAATLASIVPAIPEGVVRDGWIIDTAGNSDIGTIADLAGCEHQTGAINEVLPEIARNCVSDWLLLIDSGVILEEGWWRETAKYMDLLGRGEFEGITCASFSYASPRYGFWPRFSESLILMASYLPFAAVRRHAIIVSRQTVLQKTGFGFPPGYPGRVTVLRSKAIVPGPS
jgi:hypothetical protein